MRSANRLIVTCGFAAAAALAASAAPAAEVWSPNPMVAVFEGPDYSGKDDPDCAVRIVGTPNGRFTGQVVVYSKEPVKGTEATVTDLALKDGEGAIPASKIQIYYALPTNRAKTPPGQFKKVKGLRRFDGLSEKPRGEGRTHPVWVKVNVPPDAAPGDYEGTLTVAGRKVPVRLKVCAWKLPDPQDYVTHVNLVQSPETLALRFGVPLWSDRHLELIGRSFDLLHQVGNKVAYLTIICKTHFGNSEGMVRWVKGTEGYTYDYGIMEKYLDLYIERVGRPDVVCLYVWDYYAGGSHFGKKKTRDLGKPILVTCLDPATGKTDTMEGPAHGAPDSPAFWKPVMDGIRKRLHDRGIKDESIMVGIGGDLFPNLPTVELFLEVAPYARWFVNSHSSPSNLYKKVDVGYLAYVWGVGRIPDPDAEPDRKWKKKRYYGWRHKQIRCVFPRFAGNKGFLYPPLWTGAPLPVYRVIGESALSCRAAFRALNGFGRVGADFWGALKDSRGRYRGILNRYPQSNWNQLTMSNATEAVLHPGPDGALPTIRFEMMREGVQECEAKIFIEKALLDKAKRAKLGEENVKKYEEVLSDRLRKIRQAHPGDKSWHWLAGESGWQDRSEKLFSVAAEVAKAPR